MKHETISVTEVARNFADCVNRAHYQNTSFLLLKNGIPFARLIPDGEKVCSGGELATALAGVELSRSEAQSWRRELHAARKTLKAPADKWQ